MASMTRFQNFFRFSNIFVLLVTFELLSHYPNNASSHWLKKYFQWINDKVFGEKLMV